jgi:hypothetical protein
MSRKFTLYHSACVINLVLLTVLLLLLFHSLFFEFSRLGPPEIIPFLLVMGGFAVYYIHSFWGLTLVQRLRSGVGISPVKVQTITGWFLFQAVLQIIVFINLIGEINRIIYNFQGAVYFGNFKPLLINFLPFPVFLLTLYCQVLHFPLIKAIRRKNDELVKSIEQIGNPENL